MSDEEIHQACEYIKTHKPQATVFSTIALAIATITNGRCRAGTNEDMVNIADAWLVPKEERGKFAGIIGPGWREGFSPKVRQVFEEAAAYAFQHVDELTEGYELHELKDKNKELFSDYGIGFNNQYSNKSNYDESKQDIYPNENNNRIIRR